MGLFQLGYSIDQFLPGGTMPSVTRQSMIAVTAFLAFLLVMLLGGCGDSGSADGLEPARDGADLSTYGSTGDTIVNPAGDVATILKVGPDDFTKGRAKSGVAIYRADGDRHVIDLPDSQTPTSWGVLGDDFVVVAFPCSKPRDLDQDCDETDRSATNAYVVGDNNKLEELPTPPPNVGGQVVNRGNLAVWQADNILVTFDRTSGSWTMRTVDGPTYSPILTCPTTGLQVATPISSNGSGLITNAGGNALVATTPTTITGIAALPASKEELGSGPVACHDDGVVVHVDGEFRTFSAEGSLVRSVALPPDMTGEGWECLPIVGPMPAADCAYFGREGPTDERLVLDAGTSDQSVYSAPSDTGSPRTAIINLPQETLGVLGQAGQVKKLQQ